MGLVSVQSHPSLPLFIYNYTPSCQYSNAWSPVTTQCRGLITDEYGWVVARPFSKFMNYGQDPDVEFPPGDPIVSEKMDGSLGIIYSYDGEYAVATRGSFASDQAQWATDWLHKNYPFYTQPGGVTTLVEIIYPQNRIVVDYKGDEGLWLLGAIDNVTGADIALPKIFWWAGRPQAPTFPWDMDKAVRAAQSTSFDDGERRGPHVDVPGPSVVSPQGQEPSLRRTPPDRHWPVHPYHPRGAVQRHLRRPDRQRA